MNLLNVIAAGFDPVLIVRTAVLVATASLTTTACAIVRVKLFYGDVYITE